MRPPQFPLCLYYNDVTSKFTRFEKATNELLHSLPSKGPRDEDSTLDLWGIRNQ